MTTSMEASTGFEPELFAFFAELKEHNDREWFAANKPRYEAHVLEPALDFIEAFGPRLHAISPHFRADPRRVGGSLFRIYRDTRFSKDKTPYKTAAGINFRHERAKDVPAPGFYLHLAPGEVFGGGGIWHPDTRTLATIRDAIVADPERWREATRTPPFAGTVELGGGDAHMLKRVPAGFAKEHEFADDLRRKGFVGMTRLTEQDAIAPGFADHYARLCAATAPLIHFVCDALDLEF
jgi:uncharacterized protein (TIGR02453 family)